VAPAPGRARKALRLALYGCFLIALLVGGLRLVDVVVGRRLVKTDTLSTAFGQRTINTLELFPFDGMHVQANYHHRGPMPWNEHTPGADFDVRTGDKGYFIDFSLENPPPKAADEFRIILIGGSGAQGWGATSNERMFYSVLERVLNQRLSGRGLRVRVINLAMGSTFLFQNFVSLNLWAHALEPDLIVAYAGRNEFFVPLYHEEGTDRFLYSRDLGSFAFAARGGEYPPGMRWLVALMPNVMRRTSVGLGLKIAFGWEYFKDRSLSSYLAARGMRLFTPKQAVDDYATPLLIHSLKSIKRDFEGVPILLAWQAVGTDFDMLQGNFPPAYYDAMYERTRREVGGYLNDRWYFLNVHQAGKGPPALGLSTHLSDKAQSLVGTLLAAEVANIMPVLLADRAARLARGLPAGYGRETPAAP
jgi:hypothetical protein